jgi:hypothetical protein
MPTPTLFINTTLVKWTPMGGTLVALNRITQAGLSWGYEVINNRADLDIYDSSAHIVGAKPTVTLAGVNVGLYLNLVMGIGAIAWQIGNADDQAGTGSLIYTMTPSMNPLGDYSGPHGAYATGNLTFTGVAIDGLTNPVSYTVSSSGMFARPARIMARPTMPVPSLGIPFRPKLLTGAVSGDIPDAVLCRPDTFLQSSNNWKNVATMQVEAAKLLGVDPDSVFVRPQGMVRIVTASPHVKLTHPRESDYFGHRYSWKDRGDGVILGYLTQEALQADQDELEYAA